MTLKPEVEQKALFAAVVEVVCLVAGDHAVESVSLGTGPLEAGHSDSVSPVVASAEEIAVLQLGTAKEVLETVGAAVGHSNVQVSQVTMEIELKGDQATADKQCWVSVENEGRGCDCL